MKKPIIFLSPLVFFIGITCFNCNPAKSQIITPGLEYWHLLPGWVPQGLVEVGDEMVQVSSDYGLGDYYGTPFYMKNTLRFYRFSKDGKLLSTDSINLDGRGIRQIEVKTKGYHNVHQLSNGNFLIGAHGIARDDTLIPPWEENTASMEGKVVEHTFDTVSHINNELRGENLMVNPVIATFNPTLDSLIRLDTLPAVIAYGAVTCIHEVAPDTLIIVYHKRYSTLHEILETDSLFNIRWSKEFGRHDGWIADVADFLVTPYGHYKVSLQYYNTYNGNGYTSTYRNKIFMFHWQDGDIITSYDTWPTDRGYSFGAAMAPFQDDKMVIASDDCCERPSYHYGFNEVIFNEDTGLYLTIRDYLGNVIEERNLTDFVEMYMEAFIGPDIIYGDTVEYPDEIHPWFIPYEMIRNDDGTYFLGGWHYSTNDLQIGRGFLLKLDENLNPLWLRMLEIDKKNYYYYVDNTAMVRHILYKENRIHIGGYYFCLAVSENASPYYSPSYHWLPWYIASFYINLDEYGCAEPGCQIVDNIDLPAAGLSVKFYPNPASDMLTVDMDYSLPGHTEKILYISDMKGNQVLTHRFSSQQLSISVNHLTPGVYLAYIFAHGQVMVREKIVVE